MSDVSRAFRACSLYSLGLEVLLQTMSHLEKWRAQKEKTREGDRARHSDITQEKLIQKETTDRNRHDGNYLAGKNNQMHSTWTALFKGGAFLSSETANASEQFNRSSFLNMDPDGQLMAQSE